MRFSFVVLSTSLLALTVTAAPAPAVSPDACTNAINQAGLSTIKACHTDAVHGAAYVIMQIFKSDPGYIRRKCVPYCTGTSQAGPSPLVPDEQCQAAIQASTDTVNGICGVNARPTAEKAFDLIGRVNKPFLVAQCSPYCASVGGISLNMLKAILMSIYPLHVLSIVQ